MIGWMQSPPKLVLTLKKYIPYQGFSKTIPKDNAKLELKLHYKNTPVTDDGFIPTFVIKERKNFLNQYNFLQNKTPFLHGDVYANRHLWSADSIDENGISNTAKLEQGLRPTLKDGDKAVLHHLDQTHHSDLVVLPEKFHNKHYKLLHSDVQTSDPVIRNKFDQERQAWWICEGARITKIPRP